MARDQSTAYPKESNNHETLMLPLRSTAFAQVRKDLQNHDNAIPELGLPLNASTTSKLLAHDLVSQTGVHWSNTHKA
jgi:hypothetical protein